MKCPKCGFNSFEYYDSCKKCSADLKGHKQAYSISSLVLPQEAMSALAAQFRSNESSANEMHAAPEVNDDIFSFDLPDVPPVSSSKPVNDPFDFTEPEPAPAPAPHLTNKPPMEEHIFGDLLESTPQSDAFSFTPKVSVIKEPAASSSPEKGELDFDSFSWDAAPEAPATSVNNDTTDDFDSFFENPKGNSSK